MERIGDNVERELSRSGSRDVLPLAALTAAWPEVVGDAIARHAWPLRIARDGTLHVATASATWANELTFLADEIAERLRARTGSDRPARLKCAVGPTPESAQPPARPPEPLPTANEMPTGVVSAANTAASSIDDPELRELVARAARASLLKARSGRHFW
jgi:predicted nucleic acid-binding Zn ribbon protein